ncbi:DUF541 domain-containing protein [Virgibacillus dakarensis]|uniref:SIMPL domain-containing protein n=1 Tax=Lentibacillus populi TaxID=1827502 RepID=A0A9W5U1W6_9BACI|nr:SIMPL domain-containing protein [Lentibacillus populi]MBT2216423.1 SIMPL domain-containing protein [Virgibacillus dakarensis]MTW85881.1 DUF541 domain-containing protein [Virgibacillus dakarensis]GGB61617.1 SIMPL domain-containing protein [Lentibacillus populi]
MYYPYMPPQNRQQKGRTMKVTGTATVSAEPNLVTIQLAIVTENNELTQAQQENAQKVEKVIQSLLQLGIPRENIQTAAYTIHPHYDYVDGKQVFSGYEVTHALTVRIENIDQAGVIIDTAVQNGVNRVSNVDFTVRNSQKYYQQALRAALENATAKAETIAETIDVTLDPHPIRIVEEANEQPIVYQTFAVAKENTSTQLEPGQITFSASVRVKFQYYV